MAVRTRIRTLRLSPDEDERINLLLEARGLTFSALVRQMLMQEIALIAALKAVAPR